jgi:hypothetical protein
MNTLEKRDFIHRNLHQVSEPVLNEIYSTLISQLNELLIEESEEDIVKGNLMSHDSLKKKILHWTATK